MALDLRASRLRHRTLISCACAFLISSARVSRCRLASSATLLETTTSEFGDLDRKFLRLAVRNLSLPPPQHFRPAKMPRPNHFSYRNEEERDRSRSTFRRFPETCEALALARPISRDFNLRPDYLPVIAAFAWAWHAAELPVPRDYLRPDALPRDKNSQIYQTQRGHGDGRRLAVG